MPNWYSTREQVKRGAGIAGDDQDFALDRLIEAVSRRIDGETRRRFIPETATRLYPWPQVVAGRAHVLWVSHDLCSVTTLQTRAQDSSPTTIAAADYFLEPHYHGPPYNRIEIDLGSTAALEASTSTSQRSVSVAGSWGYGNDTATAGTVASGLASDAAATSFVCSNASLVGVGDTLLIGSEQLFVSDRAFAVLGAILIDGALTADKSEVTVTVDAGHGILQGETIQVDSERMYVSSVSGNNLTVIRAYDGTVLAAHSNNTAVQVNRTLTVVRGVNGTTAAVHANASAVSKYQPPADVVELCVAEVIAAYHQEAAGWGRTVGMGEGVQEFRGSGLGDLRKRVIGSYRRLRTGTV